MASSAGTLFVFTLLIHNLKTSRYGRTMLAVSQSETAARALGINPTGLRTLAFVISSVTAGIARCVLCVPEFLYLARHLHFLG